MKKITSRIIALAMVLALALSIPADVQAATGNSLTIKGPKKDNMLQWNIADDEGVALKTNVKVTVKILSAGSNAKSVIIKNWKGHKYLNLTGKKQLKKGYTKTFQIKNEYGTENILNIKGKIKIKITLKPSEGNVSYLYCGTEAG